MGISVTWLTGRALLLLFFLVPFARAQNSTATIAYVSGHEIRLIEADGSQDRLVWTLPDTLHNISSLAWKPDATEIAFTSNFEMAVSFYERDVYAIRPDGSGLRKLTNAPLYDEQEAYPKGTVTLNVQNSTFDGGPYFVYVEGAPEPQQVTIPSFSTVQLTFEGVADFGDGIDQPAVVIRGIQRWWDAAASADVEPNATVDAGLIEISSFRGIEHFGAESAFWRSDGTRIGFFGLAGISGSISCLLQQVPAAPSPGFYFDPIFDPSVFGLPCAADWAPIAMSADQMLVVEFDDQSETGEVHVYRATEGSNDRGELLTSFGGYVNVTDIRWLPDGSGFLIAKHDGLLERGINIYEYRFEDGSLHRLTNYTLENEGVRSFSISPDGRFVAFEYREVQDDPSPELWIMDRDGTEMRLLSANGKSPSWQPMVEQVAIEPPSEIPSSFAAMSVYPNPVRGQAVISYQLPQAQNVAVTVHDILGRAVLSLDQGYQAIGKHEERLDFHAYSAGIYFISVIGSADARSTVRALVIK